MKVLFIFMALISFTSCSTLDHVIYPGGKDKAKRSVGSGTCSSVDDKKTIERAIYSRSFTALQEALKDCDLTGQYYLHNYLTRTNNQSQNVVDMAKFFISKGAIPVEQDIPNETQEDKNREVNISILSLDGPLQSVLSSGNQTLTEFYLENMSPEDIAKGSLGFRGTTIDILMDYENRFPDSNKLVLSHILSAPSIYKSVNKAINKNAELCNQKSEPNCKALRHLKLELSSMHQGIVDITKYKGCIAQSEFEDHSELMDKQMELGIKTKVASPITYDKHAQEVQHRRKELKVYKQVYKLETNEELNLKDCG